MAKLVEAHRLDTRVNAGLFHEVVLVALAPGLSVLEEQGVRLLPPGCEDFKKLASFIG